MKKLLMFMSLALVLGACTTTASSTTNAVTTAAIDSTNVNGSVSVEDPTTSAVPSVVEPADIEYAHDLDVEVIDIVHNEYLGVMTAKTDEEGKLTEITLDETFLPHGWAEVKATTNVPEAETVSITYATSTTANAFTTKKFAKKIMVAGVVYTFDETVLEAIETTHTIGGDIRPVVPALYNLKLYVSDEEELDLSVPTLKANEELMKDFLDSARTIKDPDDVEEFDIGILDSDGDIIVDEDGIPVTDYNYFNNGMFKSVCGYWAAGGVGIGWEANTRNFLNHLIANGFEGLDGIAKPDGSGTFYVTIDGESINTNASFGDMVQYAELALKLYEEIKLVEADK